MKEKINYIKHLESIHNHFLEDERLSPWHISLYYALFHTWNHFKFQTPLSISRSEIMTASKIGSANTYLKCLKELDSWGYIKYEPSRNPMKGSQVHLYRINTSTDTTQSTSSGTTADTSLVQHLRPSINNTKHNKEKETQQTIKNVYENKSKKQTGDSENVLFIESESVSKKTFHSFPTSLEEVQTYFLEKRYTSSEAEKFYNYFESNGWLVGGRAKMKNWKAAANNWILNSKKFNPKEKDNHYHTNENKQFDIPL